MLKSIFLLSIVLFSGGCALHPPSEPSDDYQVYHANPSPINMTSPYIFSQIALNRFATGNLSYGPQAMIPLSANVYSSVSGPLSYRAEVVTDAPEKLTEVEGLACQKGLVLFGGISFFWGDGDHATALRSIEKKHDAKIVQFIDVKEDYEITSVLVYGRKCLKLSGRALLAKN